MSAQTQNLPRLSRRWLCATIFAAAFVTWQAPTARAQQYIPCPPEKQDLLQIPELSAVNNILRGVIVLGDEQQAIPFRYPPQSKPGDPSSTIRCQPQYVRTLRGVNAMPVPPAATGQFANPMPGPTLRARVGDIINLTFINQVNPSHFGNSIDRGENGFGCDQPVPPGDTYPDCFHGSSTGNIHFHGSHTNPNNTGDNVFLEIRPLPRDNQGNLTTSVQKVQEDLDKFYAQCNDRLKVSPLVIWPKSWADLPDDWTSQQKSLLQAYDKRLAQVYGIPPAKPLWPVNEKQMKDGTWPQYYIGAFPYCFRLPEYKETGWPPAAQPAAHAGHNMATGTRDGAGTAELNTKGITAPEQLGVSPTLLMGQAPGTHWYHAHKHGSTAINVANGMTGAFVIEGPYDDSLNAFYGAGWTRKQPLMIVNQLGVTPNLLRGGQGGQGGIGSTDKGPNLAVNGQMNPVIRMQPNEVRMFRIVNTSGRAGAFIEPEKAKLEWRQIAQDGVQFNYSNYTMRAGRPFLLASGNRADFLVQAKPCPGNQPTCQYEVKAQIEVDPSDLQKANKVTIFTVEVSGTPIPTTSPNGQFIPQDKYPVFPAFLKDIADSDVKGTRTVTFASTGPNLPAAPNSGPPMAAQHTINGEKFSGEVGELVKLNTVEEWKIVNQTYGPPISHPFHIHINPFQVTEIFDPREALINPTTKKPYPPNTVDPQTQAYPVKYVFRTTNLLAGQCSLDPDDPKTWRPLTWTAKGCFPTPFVNKDNIWWDVFPIPSGYAPSNKQTQQPLLNKAGQPIQVPGYFKMRSRFVDYAGYYVIHCHILAHEDRGMMTVVEVSPAPLPYSHN